MMHYLKRHIIQTYIISFAVIALLWFECIEIWAPPKSYIGHTHKTLYVDRNFDTDQFISIVQAALRWNEATNHIINYNVVRLPITNGKQIANPDDSIIIDLVSPDLPDVIAIDTLNENTTLGYYKEHEVIPMIGIINERIDDNNMFEQVILHELGHSVGLKHNEGLAGINTLMYPSVNLASDYITQEEIINFCKLYSCDPNKLKYEKESPHL
jgi:hypothetical protein